MNTQTLFDPIEAPRPWSSQYPHDPPHTPRQGDNANFCRSYKSHDHYRSIIGHSVKMNPSINNSSQVTVIPLPLGNVGQRQESSPDSLLTQLTTACPPKLSPTSRSSSDGPYGPERHRLFSKEPSSNLGCQVLRPKLASLPALPFFFFNDNMVIKDDLAIAAGKVSPGVDDTPYIQYAIEALTKDHRSAHHTPTASEKSFLKLVVRPRVLQDLEKGLPTVSNPRPTVVKSTDTLKFSHHSGAVTHLTTDLTGAKTSLPKAHWLPVTEDMLAGVRSRHVKSPRLDYKPAILRPFSFILLIIMCLLMIAACTFCVEHSSWHHGLMHYAGTQYSGQYFLYRVLPQLLAAIILIYAQSIVGASIRVLPFVALAHEDPSKRNMALFQRLSPKSFLFPQWVGPWQFKLFDFTTWMLIFSLPLQSSAFACTFSGHGWVWVPVRGVVWTLVGLYSLLVIASVLLMAYWFQRWTGLLWDIRSIADLLPLLNRSNTLSSYDQRNLDNADETDFKMSLRDRTFDRLGYWTSEFSVADGAWYSIGAPFVTRKTPERSDIQLDGRNSRDRPSFESEDLKANTNITMHHGRYLPWCLRTGALTISTVMVFLFVTTMVVVAFIPPTRIDKGFRPMLPTEPSPQGFSSAGFLYSFLPAAIGMLFFILFQSVDLSLRELQPWGELSQLDGSPARKSLLADYAACLPFQATWKAMMNGHWRLALTTLMAQAFVFIPILGGGLFIPLTSHGAVRIFPNMAVFGVLVALMIVYLGCLVVIFPRRSQFELPHPVTSLAYIISLCSVRELVEDAAFRAVRSRSDLEDRLGITGSKYEESIWFYGVVPGRDEHRVSVRRMQRYTTRRLMQSITPGTLRA